MSNIIEAIQMNLGYSSLQKIDPNSQQTKKHQEQASVEKLAQAAIPAVLTAVYKFSRTDAGSNVLIKGMEKQDWLSVIYAGKEKEAVEKVAQFAGVDPSEADTHMENIADEAVKVIRESVGTNPNAEKVKTYMNSQRHNILVHLPAALDIGDTLDDKGLDDKTNKMEGPVSSLMHKIENSFSDGDKKEGQF